MRNQLTSVLSMCMFAMLLFSCQKDEQVVPVRGDAALTLRAHDCNVDCLEEGDTEFFEHTDFVQMSAGMSGGYRRVDYTFYNTLTTFVVEWSYTTATVGGNRYIKVDITGGPVVEATMCTGSVQSPGASGMFAFTLAEGAWEACDGVSFTISAIENNCANAADFSETNTYQLVGECTDDCENSLTAEVNCSNDECNRSVTFTFVAEEDGPTVIQGGLTAFTSICEAYASAGLTLNPDHPSAGGPSNVTRWEGNVVACQEYTVTILWTSTNGDPNITGTWTAKRDGVTLASIDPLTCPE